MNKTLQAKVLLITAFLLLACAGGLASWLGHIVLDPIRNVQVTATGSSIYAEPRTLFRNGGYLAQVGQPVAIPVGIDSNGGSLGNITADFQYSPLDMSVGLGATGNSICNAFTSREHDTVTGRFVVSCTAPTSTGGQVAPFVTFIVTPLRSGVHPIKLAGRLNEYAVITAQ
ncbi:MAG TPA: hypothetical protein VLA04_04695 [Verrucomicrobiae bacterium]|nr:hypothetical protein [Verrucomicrobiae bacterium]